MTTYNPAEKKAISKLSQLRPEDIEEMSQVRLQLKDNWSKNTQYHIVCVNNEGTRYLIADRHTDFYGRSSSFSYWKVRYGKISWHFSRTSNPFEPEYTPEFTFGQCFSKSLNGTFIRSSVGTKKEVMELIAAIGIF